MSSAGAVRVGRPPTDHGLPADFFLIPSSFRREPGALVGGEPFTVWRVAARDEAALDGLLAGGPVGAHGELARALVARNLAQPVPPRPRSSLGGPGTTVAAVVPVRNRAPALARLLPVLATTAGEHLGELVVVDDASDDDGRTAATAARLGARVVRRRAQGGPAAARNDGLAATRAPLVAFVDSDCLPRPGWLEALLPHFADPLVGLVGPRVIALDGDRGGAVARYEAARSPLDRGERPARVLAGGVVPFLPGAALLARRSALGEGFDESLPGGEDVDLVWRLTGAGWHVRYEPAGEVAHDHRTRLGELAARRFTYGRSAAPLARAHPGAAPPVAVSPWTLAAWAALAGRRPALAGGILAVATGLAARRLSPAVARPVPVAVRVALLGSLASWRAVADTAVRAWLPFSLAAAGALPRARPALAAGALLPALYEWRALRPPLGPASWTALRLLDDASYGLGTWFEALREGRPDLLVWPLPWRLGMAPLRASSG